MVPGPGRETRLWAFSSDASSRATEGGCNALYSSLLGGWGSGLVKARKGPSPPQNRDQLSSVATDRTVPPPEASSQPSY